MRCGNWQFAPGVWPSVATLILLPALMSLGFWQLDRADQKKTMYQVFLEKQNAPETDLNAEKSLRSNSPELLWRKTKALGEFEQQAEILLDNQVMNQEPGYFVFTPFRLAGEQTWILANRGWVPAGTDRNILPETRPVSAEAAIKARVTEAPATGILLEDETIETPAAGVYRAQRIDIVELSMLLKHDLLPFVLRLEPESDHGYTRVWTVPGSGAAKHLGYAFQWFALALTLLVIYIVVNLKRAGHE